MRCLDRGIRCGHCCFEGFPLTQSAAQDGIDDAAGAPGERHRFIDGSVWRRSHMENLVKTEPDHRAGVRIDHAFSQLGRQEIKPAQVPQDAKKCFHEKRSVERSQRSRLDRRVEDFVGKLAAFLPFKERADAGEARIRGH